MTLLLSRKDVAGLLTMGEAIAAVEQGFRELALGRVRMPQRTVIRVEEHNGTHLGMPACIGGAPGALALKVVTVYPENPEKHNLPTTNGVLLLSDPATGDALAVMDAGHLTAVRTGAASGVATKYLSRRDARRVGVIGAGVQGRTQLEGVCAVRAIESAVVYDPDGARSRAFADEMSSRLSRPVRAAASAREAIDGQDVIVIASTSTRPVLDGAWLAPGQHINAVGTHTPGTRELDTTTIVRAKVFADQVEACLAEAGDLIIPIQEGAITPAHVAAGLGEVIAGLRPGRTADEDLTVFKSVGLAVQDASTARVVYDKAVKAGAGTRFAF